MLTVMTSGRELWEQVESLLAKHVPDMVAALRPPADPAKLAAAEAHFGVRLPEELRFAYLRHDGCYVESDDTVRLFLPYYRWHSLDECVAYWDILKPFYDRTFPDRDMYPDDEENWTDELVRPSLWIPAWIPIGGSGTEANLCADMRPAPAGVLGQLIETSDYPTYHSPGFDAYLRWLIRGLSEGTIRYDMKRPGWAYAATGEPIYSIDAAEFRRIGEVVEQRPE
jgi:cell wall assembly regulator SMI1